MVRVADARSTRSLNRRSFGGGIFELNEKVRADFYGSVDARLRVAIEREHQRVRVQVIVGSELRFNVRCEMQRPNLMTIPCATLGMYTRP